MTAPCPICRTPTEVDDAKLGADGTKVQCALCEEVFVVRSQAAAPAAGQAGGSASSSSGKTGQTRTPSQPASASRRLLEEDAEGSAPRVLVAHDSHVFADTVKALLEEEGFDVEVVHDGVAATSRITEEPPRVAIVEAGLPKKFGFQLCADMRAVPEAAGVKFLLVASIYDRKRFAGQSDAATAPDDFLEPRNLEIELLPKVRRLLRGRQENTASRPAATGARRVAADSSAVEEELEALSGPAATAASRDEDRPSTSRPTVDEDDFKDLFEDSEFQNTGSRPSGPAPSTAEVADVDDVLATDGGSAAAVKLPAADDEEDLLRGVLDDSSDPELPRSAPKEPDHVEEEPPSLAGDGERAEHTGTGGTEGDELLRTLMRMASSDGVEPSKPSLEDDEVLPDGEEDAAPRKGAPASEDELLGGILEDAPEPNRPSFALEEEDRRSSSGEVPASWEADSQEQKIATTPDDELEKLLGAASQEEAPRAAPARKDAQPAAADPDEVVKMSEFEIDGAAAGPSPSAAAKNDAVKPGKQPAFEEDLVSISDFDGSAAAPGRKAPGGSSSPGFELESDGDLRAALESDAPFESGGGPSKSGGITPTVIKKQNGAGRMPASAENGGGSLSATASVGGDDDEKSLAEAKSAPREMDDELDRLLTGGGGEGGASRAAAPASEPAPAPAASAGAASGKASEHEKARRLAKLIVGDIVLYNAERIADAVKSGTFFEVMKGDIKDGRDFYDEKVPEDVRREHDYIQEVLEEVLAKKRKELGLA